MRITLPLLAITILAPGALAQGWIEPNRPAGNFGVVRTRTSVSVRVTGRVARVEVEEWFRNQGGGLGEGDYLYPLPGEAVFADLSLFQGDVELKGETMDADRARRIYEEIVRRKKDPALIELAGHGLLRARVFPINPGETRKITLRYTQVLGRAGDALQLRYAAGGRYDGGAGGRTDGTEGAVAPQRVREAVPLQFVVTVDSAGRFRDPFSPTHEVDDNLLSIFSGCLQYDFIIYTLPPFYMTHQTSLAVAPPAEIHHLIMSESSLRVCTHGKPHASECACERLCVCVCVCASVCVCVCVQSLLPQCFPHLVSHKMIRCHLLHI